MTPRGKRVVMVAAVAENGVIGNGPDIPWRLPGEQAEFKRLTMGHVLLMGRTTYDSIGRPLPGRTTIVLTRDRAWSAEGVLVAHDLESALTLAEGLPGDVMVAGGGEVYASVMSVADEQVLTVCRCGPKATRSTRRTTPMTGSGPGASRARATSGCGWTRRPR